jgi:hypothetical protein
MKSAYEETRKSLVPGKKVERMGREGRVTLDHYKGGFRGKAISTGKFLVWVGFIFSECEIRLLKASRATC